MILNPPLSIASPPEHRRLIDEADKEEELWNFPKELKNKDRIGFDVDMALKHPPGEMRREYDEELELQVETTEEHTAQGGDGTQPHTCRTNLDGKVKMEEPSIGKNNEEEELIEMSPHMEYLLELSISKPKATAYGPLLNFLSVRHRQEPKRISTVKHPNSKYFEEKNLQHD
ncbi:hypothetical protein BT69DRAFT_1332429 [Atractiella rhizophila]|nr:hypothetical protein BT69DRAFT_1332429 [Atractiella rhizophila]